MRGADLVSPGEALRIECVSAHVSADEAEGWSRRAGPARGG